MSHILAQEAPTQEPDTSNDRQAVSQSTASISGENKDGALQKNPAEAKRLQDIAHYKELVRARFTELTALLKDCDTKESVKNACSRYVVLEKMEQLRQRIMVALWTFTADVREVADVHALEPVYLSFVFNEIEWQRYVFINKAIKEYQAQQQADAAKVINA